jgi:ubiquinone/menaquinone biosynthesis C-methylase UbiE
MKLVPEAEFALQSGKLSHQIQDAHNLTFKDGTFDRVIFMCVLHHLYHPEKALTEAKRVVRPGGLVSIYLPCDPGLVYRIFRRIFTSKKAKSLGIDYELTNVREHINHYYQLNKLIEYVFSKDDVQKSSFPLKFTSYDFRLYSIYQITKRAE